MTCVFGPQESHYNIEARKRRNSEFEVFVDCDSDHQQLRDVIQLLQKHMNLADMDLKDNFSLPDDGTVHMTSETHKKKKNDMYFYNTHI